MCIGATNHVEDTHGNMWEMKSVSVEYAINLHYEGYMNAMMRTNGGVSFLDRLQNKFQRGIIELNYVSSERTGTYSILILVPTDIDNITTKRGILDILGSHLEQVNKEMKG